MIIKDINLRKIIDSRGNPTVEADIVTNEGFGRAAAPAGASTGTFEAQAWPKNNVDLGISNAKQNVIPSLIGIASNDQETFDETIKDKDGTKMTEYEDIGEQLKWKRDDRRDTDNASNISVHRNNTDELDR